MTQRIPTDDLALRVWERLWNAESSGLSFDRIMTLERITRAQTIRALTHISHVLQETEGQPIVSQCRNRRHVYVLPDFVADAKEYSRNRLSDCVTRLKTERTRFTATKARWPREIHSLTLRSMDRAIEDMEDLLTQV